MSEFHCVQVSEPPKCHGLKGFYTPYPFVARLTIDGEPKDVYMQNAFLHNVDPSDTIMIPTSDFTLHEIGIYKVLTYSPSPQAALQPKKSDPHDALFRERISRGIVPLFTFENVRLRFRQAAEGQAVTGRAIRTADLLWADETLLSAELNPPNKEAGREETREDLLSAFKAGAFVIVSTCEKRDGEIAVPRLHVLHAARLVENYPAVFFAADPRAACQIELSHAAKARLNFVMGWGPDPCDTCACGEDGILPPAR